MRKFISIILIVVFSFVNVCFILGCGQSVEASAEVRACWIASIGNLDYPSKMGLSAKQLRGEIDKIVINCRDVGLNTIFFQVRPNGDALYSSTVFPWSVYLSGKQGVAPDESFDPLAYFVQQAHDYGIALHAWINPYRVGSGQNVWESLSENNPAVLHPEYTITTETGVYYNPALPEVRQLVLDGISELVRNYEIDGIHFDDYFYPYDLEGFDDSAAYKKYGSNQKPDDFRRKSVDQLVGAAHRLIKTLDDTVQFGISPFGIWANKSVHKEGSNTNGLSAYSDIFADSKKWVEQGWLDYICPQVYWSNENQAAPFEVVVDWWSALCSKNKVDLYIGLALYKVGTDEAGWESGNIMEQQLTYASSKKAYCGHCFFRYGAMMKNPLGALDSVRRYYAANPIEKYEFTEPVKEIVLEPTSALKITSPQNGEVFNTNKISVSGTCNAKGRVMVNGVEAKVSKMGFFSAYVPLSKGKNTIRASTGGRTETIAVTYQAKSAERGFRSYPIGDVVRNAGDIVSFRVETDSGLDLKLINKAVEIEFEEKNGIYTAEWTVPSFPATDKLTLDGFYYVADNRKIDTELSITLYSEGYIEEQVLQTDSCLYDESVGGSQMDHEPMPKGSFVSVVGFEGERARLDNGFWVDRGNLTSDKVTPNEVLNTTYEMVTVSAGQRFDYSVSSDENAVFLLLSGGRSLDYHVEAGAEVCATLDQSGNGSTLRISNADGKKICGYRLFPQKNKLTIYLTDQSEGLDGMTVLLDAGHGGSDEGASGPGGNEFPTEKELNRMLAYLLKQELEAAGAEVILTRAADERVTLGERVDCSLRVAPDLFISVHHNAVDQTTDFNRVSGGLVLYSAPISKGVAQSIAKTIWSGVGAAADCRRQSLAVCRQYHCPSVLIEAGFLSNPSEYEMLCRQDIALKIAKNIVVGIENYYVTDYS